MRMTDALTKRKQIKSKKPDFLAQDTHKKKRIRQRWKRPRGLQSKVRLNKRGYRRGVSTGWRSPKSVRGLSPEGLIQVRVETLAQLEALDPKTQGAIVSGRVSIRTKKALYDAATAKKITILNRDAKVFEDRYAARMADRESRKKQLEEKRKRQEKLKKDLEKTKESGVAAEGLKAKAAEKKATDNVEATSDDTATETKPASEAKSAKAEKAPAQDAPAAKPKADKPKADAPQAEKPKADEKAKTAAKPAEKDKKEGTQ